MGMPYRMTLAYARPNRVRVEVTRQEGDNTTKLRIVANEAGYFAFSSQYPKRYLKTTPTTGKSVLSQALQAADSKIDLISGFMEQGQTMLKYLTDPKNGGIMSMGEPDTVDGVAVDTIVLVKSGPGYKSTGFIQIGRADHLMRRIQFTEDDQGQPRTTTQTFTGVRANFTPTASTFAFIPPMGAVAASPAGAVKPNPKAVELMSRMYAAYKALQTFSCTAQMEAVMPARDSQGKPMTLRSQAHASYQFQQPNKIAFSRTNQNGTARAVSDGRTLYAMTDEDKSGPEEWRAQSRYLKREAPSGMPWNDSLTLARFGGLPVYGFSTSLQWMPELVLGINFMPAEGGYGFQLGKPTVLGGEPVAVVFLRQQSIYQGGIPADKGTLTLWISQRDHLLRRVSDEWVRSDGISRSVETYTNVKVNLNLPPSTFEFTPPDNGLAVDSVESLLPPRPVIGPKLNIGDAVPAAAFGATDVDGKRVEAADYEGKVVLLDFWATWCGPCIRQIPSLVATYQQYHDQGLEIVGYAIEEAKNKDKLPAFTLKHGMAWRQVWDKDAVIANACGPTNGVPFAIVVGRDGRIAALGNPGEGLDVDAAIRAALAKPLPSASTL
jgi:outer membrane lipoprotein-sorting protein/peroxiredoxin